MEKDPRQSMLRPVIVLCFFFLLGIQAHRSPRTIHKRPSPVKLLVTDSHVEIDNDIIKLTLLKPTGSISGVGNKQVPNVLEYHLPESRRGYWDTDWNRLNGGPGHFDTLDCTSFRVIVQTEKQVEVSFTKTWNASFGENVMPLNIDKRYIVLSGVSGFYTYSIFEHKKGWPDLYINNARVAFKLSGDIFHFMAISDDIQKEMPSGWDRSRGTTLDYKEAVLLTQPPSLKGQVDDKYQYACNNEDIHVHGWISSKLGVGFWVITPSSEYLSGGPIKQDLTSHTGPTSLAMFFSGHYTDRGFGVGLQSGEAWKKVYGPVFIYLNSGSSNNELWIDAKRQMSGETKKWPYSFPASADFPHPNQRGRVEGRLLVNERRHLTSAKSAYVGLAAPGYAGSWEHETKGYQFWTRTDERGRFTIRGVRAGTYSLYAWVPGFIGDFKHDTDIVIKPGSKIMLGNVVYYPPTNGLTMWEIGIPDRTAAEFYVPDPVPGLVNKVFGNKTQHKYRQYGLWNQYTKLYPHQDLIYKVGVSDYRKDWFFAHATRNVGNSFAATTWQIIFDARDVIKEGTYTLRLALASAHSANIQVWMNRDPNGNRPHFETGRIGLDNAIARHGIHGVYRLYSVSFAGSELVDGSNTIYLRQSKGSYIFAGVLYDYIRLERPYK